MLVYPLHFPRHIATGMTSFTPMSISRSWILVSLIGSGFEPGISHTLCLGVGMMSGAQGRARLSQRVAGTMISRIMVGGLLLIGISLVIHALEI